MKSLTLISAAILIISCNKENDKKNSDASKIISSKVRSHSVNLKKDLGTVAGIKLEYNLVNDRLAKKKLDSASFKYECEERSGNIVYYSENGKLKVIKHFQADSHFSSVDHYFVDDNKPYFILKDETVWSFDGGTPEKPVTKDDVTEKRFYLVDDKPIQCLEKKYTLKSSSANNPKSENVPNKEMKNCSVADLQKDFKLLTNKKNKNDGSCL